MTRPVIAAPEGPRDWAEMRAICAETAGRPVPPREADAFGRKWIGPYERWAPRWAYVARDEGRVVGYLTGCPSSARFYAASALLGPRPALGAAARFPLALQLRLLRRYPAHLHVNVREGHRGGTGRALVERFEADAAAAGARGVHVFCAEAPKGFYLKLGFSELARLRRGEAWIYALGRTL